MSAMIVTAKPGMTASYTVNGTKSRFKIGPPAAGTDPVPVTADPTDLKVYDFIMALKADRLVSVTMGSGSKAAHEAAVTAAAQNGALPAGPDQATLDALDEAQSNAVSLQKTLDEIREAIKATEDLLANATDDLADANVSLSTEKERADTAEGSLATEKERADTTEEKLEASEQRGTDLAAANTELTDRVAELEASAKDGK